VRRMALTSVVWWGPSVIDEVTGRDFLVAASYGGSMNAGSLEVLDTHSGRLLRTIPFPLGTGLAAVTLDERIGRVFATAFGPVRMVTIPESGDGSATFAAPVGAGSVRLLDARSGRLLHTIPIGPATTAVAVDGHRGRLYVTNAGAVDAASNPVGPGTLTVLDERSGRVLRTVAVGVNPVNLVLDRRAGRLFVVNVGNYNPNPLRSADPWAWMPNWLRHWLPFLPQHAPPPRRIPGSVTVLDTSRL
jgi:DNA-binding beta-propeller fold protein YncE